ncbi:Altered inheritance of mitochondria protein 41 mitochondrial [Alternaria triticimaculans]|uniref:Altered inheritance of mitochondria protein 41 mitochondrial n=1 Tax=Alternaria triticimaculans TaxID=297637 RepID=UPI0020C2BCA6|nr:Altered inheritance of mitochondria protein 41 mitochondrial [Alternaria triticimaculans]KAI4647522.1 Altered inheritance of mitochondria protein 41 mitochondrial [Alternaria triticimaculans]
MSLFRTAMLQRQLFTPARSLCVRYSSTSTSENFVLPRLQSDLKTAMRAKNKPALNTIRALQAEIINASKTAKPIETDGALYSLVQKQIKASSASIEEFRNAKREDLVEKEQAHLDVLKGYAQEIPLVENSEVDALVKSVIEGLEEGKRSFGSVMGKVMGGLKGRPFDLEYVTKKIQEAVGAK